MKNILRHSNNISLACKNFIGICLLFFFLASSSLSYSQDSIEIQNEVETAVLKWAQDTFKSYDHPRFEKLKIFYSMEYEMWKMRPKMIESSMDRLEKRQKNGDLTKKKYETQKTKLEKQLKQAKEKMNNIKNFADSIAIHFWSNILTNDGITVQYEHIITLNSDYNIIDSEVNSSIGKKSKSTQIVYR